MNEIEKFVESWLISKNIFPFSVLYVKDPQFLKISVHLESDIQEILEIIKYSSLCDNSGIHIFNDTILFMEMGLINFFKHVDN